MENDETIYYPPGDAARRLDVSPSGLRRYASFYEEIHGELPRDSQGRRMWPGKAVGRLEAAKALMANGQASSIKDALTSLESGVQPPAESLGVTVPGDALRLLLEEMKAMREHLEGVERLELEVQALRRQLDAPGSDVGREVELARMNAYLLGELERRRQEAKTITQRKAWWKFW